MLKFDCHNQNVHCYGVLHPGAIAECLYADEEFDEELEVKVKSWPEMVEIFTRRAIQLGTNLLEIQILDDCS